jgi:hypothetical protein
MHVIIGKFILACCSFKKQKASEDLTILHNAVCRLIWILAASWLIAYLVLDQYSKAATVPIANALLILPKKKPREQTNRKKVAATNEPMKGSGNKRTEKR